VETAADGAEGLSRFAASRPDAVLLDVRLPGMGGREVLERIRAADAALPVIMMTGFASVDDAMGAMWSGATDYVRKPLKADEVADALERALSARRAGEAGPSTVRSRALGGGTAPAPPPPRRAAPAPGDPPSDPADWLRGESLARGLPDPGEDGGPTLEEAVRLFERILVDAWLRDSGGNVARAARAAGISRPNFHRKMRTLGIDAGPYRKRPDPADPERKEP